MSEVTTNRNGVASLIGPIEAKVRRSRGRVCLVLLRWMLVGAAINVGVVWTMVLFNLGDAMTYSSGQPSGHMWPVVGPPLPPAQSVVRSDSWGRTRFNQTRSVAESYTPTISIQISHYSFAEQLGFPMRAVGWWTSESLVTVDAQWPQHGLITVPNGKFDDIELPVTPVWPGFAVNSVLYAAAAWGMLRILRRVRGALRRQAEPAAA